MELCIAQSLDKYEDMVDDYAVGPLCQPSDLALKFTFQCHLAPFFWELPNIEGRKVVGCSPEEWAEIEPALYSTNFVTGESVATCLMKYSPLMFLKLTAKSPLGEIDKLLPEFLSVVGVRTVSWYKYQQKKAGKFSEVPDSLKMYDAVLTEVKKELFGEPEGTLIKFPRGLTNGQNKED